MLLARLREVGSEGNRHHHDNNYEPRCRLERWALLAWEELVIFAHADTPIEAKYSTTSSECVSELKRLLIEPIQYPTNSGW